MDPDLCGTIESSLTPNLDMAGIAVAVATVIVSFCSRILVTWSPTYIDVGIAASLIQSYPILLSTLLSIGRKSQLSFFDAQYALTITSPPLMVYLTVASISDLLGIQTGLYKRIRSHRRTTRALGALILPLWLGLSLTLGLSSRAFTASQCFVETFAEWLVRNIYGYLVSGVLYGYGGWIATLVYGSLFLICLFRRRSQVMVDFRAHRKGASKPWGWWSIPWTFVGSVWRIIDRNHKWWTYCLFAYLDCSWALLLISNATLTSFDGYGYALSYEYVLSYGQLLSLFAAVPPLVSTVKFVYASRWDLLHVIRRFPRLFLAEVVFLLAGIEPGPPIQDIHLPFNVTSGPEMLTLDRLYDGIARNAQLDDQPSLFA